MMRNLLACGLGYALITVGCLVPETAQADPGQPESDPAETAARLLSETGVQGGIVVHLGCGDGRLTAALCANEHFTVHGLSPHAEQIAAARVFLDAHRPAGYVSFEPWSQTALPYADNVVNLIVVQEPHGISPEECLRVLVPGGVACVQAETGWQKQIKPRPETIDEWSHFLHDAGNNAVARDSVVGPPRSLQWVASPRWLRSHETPSGVEGLVSSGGRIFYYFDEGLIGITDQRIPERWSLVCRDAFNGRLLWKRPVSPWGWPEWAESKFADQDWIQVRGGRTVVPDENQRRLVADGERLYATLGYQAPLSILDATTGQILSEVAGTEPAREILASDGIVLVHVRAEPTDAETRRGTAGTGNSILAAVDAASAKVIWRKETQTIPNLALAVDEGRVVYHAGSELSCLGLRDGKSRWSVPGPKGKSRTLIAHANTIVLYAGKELIAYDAEQGQQLWRQSVPPSSGGESLDVFIVDGVVWRGMVAVNADLKPIGKSEDAMAVGYALRTGEQKKQIVVRGLRSPEHHHRCYRNKATERYLISGMEGAEFMDLSSNDHTQNNFLRGACKLGVMPCNGLLYAPPDQCFCQPGAKLLGFAALAANRIPATTEPPSQNDADESASPDPSRLERGPAYGQPLEPPTPENDGAADWPTFRYNAARHGATTTEVPEQVEIAWQQTIGGNLTQPVQAGGRIFIASRDTHKVVALDAESGAIQWQYTAGGRIDSPPTIYRGLVLFGSADGRMVCLRAADGQLVYRFLAAPIDLRIGAFDQLESLWPVHGSVLIRDGLAYITAGRSTYLDGGIRVFALEPATGKVMHQTVLEGPFPVVGDHRDEAFYLLGANSDVLVSEGDFLYMRQKKLTPDLREISAPVLSSKGEQDVGLHLFSTAGLLDDSWYNRTFWMYSQRWPGFQLANQAPKSGQLLVIDDETTFAVRVFYRRNVHSPMFFPDDLGYLLFADRNGNEPQIVGEAGAREPVAWLPQSHIPREGNPGLNSTAFGQDKKMGYTRAELPLWSQWLPIRIRAMVKAGPRLYVAGPPDEFDPEDPYAAFEGRRGGMLGVVAAEDGTLRHTCPLDAVPVFDGLIAAAGRLVIALEDGRVIAMGSSRDGDAPGP